MRERAETMERVVSTALLLVLLSTWSGWNVEGGDVLMPSNDCSDGDSSGSGSGIGEIVPAPCNLTTYSVYVPESSPSSTSATDMVPFAEASSSLAHITVTPSIGEGSGDAEASSSLAHITVTPSIGEGSGAAEASSSLVHITVTPSIGEGSGEALTEVYSESPTPSAASASSTSHSSSMQTVLAPSPIPASPLPTLTSSLGPSLPSSSAIFSAPSISSVFTQTTHSTLMFTVVTSLPTVAAVTSLVVATTDDITFSTLPSPTEMLPPFLSSAILSTQVEPTSDFVGSITSATVPSVESTFLPLTSSQTYAAPVTTPSTPITSITRTLFTSIPTPFPPPSSLLSASSPRTSPTVATSTTTTPTALTMETAYITTTPLLSPSLTHTFPTTISTRQETSSETLSTLESDETLHSTITSTPVPPLSVEVISTESLPPQTTTILPSSITSRQETSSETISVEKTFDFVITSAPTPVVSVEAFSPESTQQPQATIYTLPFPSSSVVTAALLSTHMASTAEVVGSTAQQSGIIMGTPDLGSLISVGVSPTASGGGVPGVSSQQAASLSLYVTVGGSVGGVCVGIACIVVIIVVLVCCKRRRHRKTFYTSGRGRYGRRPSAESTGFYNFSLSYIDGGSLATRLSTTSLLSLTPVTPTVHWEVDKGMFDESLAGAYDASTFKRSKIHKDGESHSSQHKKENLVSATKSIRSSGQGDSPSETPRVLTKSQPEEEQPSSLPSDRVPETSVKDTNTPEVNIAVSKMSDETSKPDDKGSEASKMSIEASKVTKEIPQTGVEAAHFSETELAKETIANGSLKASDKIEETTTASVEASKTGTETEQPNAKESETSPASPDEEAIAAAAMTSLGCRASGVPESETTTVTATEQEEEPAERCNVETKFDIVPYSASESTFV